MKELKPRFAKRGQTPWGWQRDANNAKMISPIPDALSLLDEAYQYLDKLCTYRSVAAWLSHKSGIPMDHAALYRRYQKHIADTKPRLIKKIAR